MGHSGRPRCATLRKRSRGTRHARLLSRGRRTRGPRLTRQRFIRIERHQRARLILWEFLADLACGF